MRKYCFYYRSPFDVPDIELETEAENVAQAVLNFSKTRELKDWPYLDILLHVNGPEKDAPVEDVIIGQLVEISTRMKEKALKTIELSQEIKKIVIQMAVVIGSLLLASLMIAFHLALKTLR